MEKKLTIEMCSDLDFEGMVIDVRYDTHPIASINYDKGINNMEVEFCLFGGDFQKITLPLQDFLDVMEKAKKLALKCAEEDILRKK